MIRGAHPHMQRTALATSALSLLALAALTACASTDTAEGAAGPRASVSPARTFSPADELARLMVTGAESGGYTVKKPAVGYALATSQEEMTVDKAACAPLAYAMNELPLGTPRAALTHVADKSSGMLTYITLSTYADGGAETAMKSLSKAAGSCTAGYAARSDTGATTYDSVSVEAAPTGGDESLATAATFTYQGLTQTLRTRTFRFGNTIANYFTLDSSAFMQPHAAEAKIPTELVGIQNAKLG
jgi:hypothetical protein